jgi:SAM-dependent methyltransferase
MSAGSSPWNHNIHYHPVILRAVPDGCMRALDVGCGDGILARQLRKTVHHVTGIDLDETSISLARQRTTGDDIDYIVGDFLTHKFEPALFDVIVSVAAVHHMDTAAALERMRSLLRPGGTLAVIGLARNNSASPPWLVRLLERHIDDPRIVRLTRKHPADAPFDLAAKVANRLHKLTKNYSEHSAPMATPRDTYKTVRLIAKKILPGVRYRRHILWRYSLVWVKPR